MTEVHTSTIDGRMRDEEVRRRFPEVDLIENDEIREATISALGRGVPDYFWKVPATSSGRYHNPFSRSKYGLWIHTKMVFTAFERLQRSWVERGKPSEFDVDLCRSAILLHDMLKYGHAYKDGDGTVKNHDKLAGHWIRHNTELPNEVARAVETHNGPWYEGPEPSNEIEEIVHEADMIASTKNVTCGVYKPADEIRSTFPNLPEADL